MKACASSSGGVMFIPDEIERKEVKPTQYSEFVEKEGAAKKIGIFGKMKAMGKKAKKKAA